ncbi:uncharacterized protein LY89DRAFT_509554 [Mollisia scopiformis]|uniref:Uncharacterized protein n=1 Tax=Mollisia scopiformis TaxID=149040 RepID=A0A194XFQ4_MOLSC|nr:uncharacterized protein LY89DRAFT_509554 [Mollisia scopiformis]KUJ18998.1 hypothetical protein LY89DRAFT_509554 [Mollisia scopiformis]
MGIIKHSLNPGLEAYRDIKTEPPAFAQENKAISQGRAGCEDTECFSEKLKKMDHQRPAPCVRLEPAPMIDTAFVQPVISSSQQKVKHALGNSDQTQEPVPPAQSPLRMIPRPRILREPRQRSFLISDPLNSNRAQIMISADSQAMEPLIAHYSDDRQSPFDAPRISNQGPFLGLDDLNDFSTFVQPPQTMYDYDNHKFCSATEDISRGGTDVYVDSHDFEGLLSFESSLPDANGPIKHVRDMNKGLKGRYEFDGSM